MAIIQSCCFWKSLRKGCFASALYTFVSVAGENVFMQDVKRVIFMQTKKHKRELERKFKDFFFSDVHLTLVFLQIYFFISCISISLYLYDEREYLTGRSEKPTSKTFLGGSPCKCSHSKSRHAN